MGFLLPPKVARAATDVVSQRPWGRWPRADPPLSADEASGSRRALLLQAGARLGAAGTASSTVPGHCLGQGGGDSRDEDLLHIVDDLLAHHDDQ